MLIRHAREDDWDDVVRIEQENFSPEEAATPEAIAERLETICDTFLIAEIDGVVAGYIEGPVIAERYLTDDLFIRWLLMLVKEVLLQLLVCLSPKILKGKVLEQP